MLSYDDKVIKNIIHSFMNFEKSIKIPASSEADVCSLIAYLRYESTILFHLGEVKYVFYPRFKEAVLTPCYLYSKKDYETIVSQLAATVQKIRDQICTSPTNIEREMRIHDALCTNVTYADDGSESHSIVGPLLYHRAVCDGISKTAKVLFQECGIKSHVVFGTAVTTDGKPEPHAWNVVCLNGKWYHLDITFDRGNNEKDVYTLGHRDKFVVEITTYETTYSYRIKQNVASSFDKDFHKIQEEIKELNSNLNQKVGDIKVDNVSVVENGVALIDLTTPINEALNSLRIGLPNGVATLDSSGKVPQNQLPSYVDDVLELFMQMQRY